LSTGGYFDGSVRDWKRVESGTEHGWTKKAMVNLPRGLTPSNLWDILRSWSLERNDISIGISPVYQWHVTVVGSQMVAKCRPFFSSIKRIQKEIPTAQREPFEMNVHVGLIVLSKLLRPHCLTVLEEEFLFEKNATSFLVEICVLLRTHWWLLFCVVMSILSILYISPRLRLVLSYKNPPFIDPDV
jgi:hypothetical protein